MVESTADVRFRDFSLPPDNPRFRIAPDEFRCYPEIPLDVMLDVSTFGQGNDVSTRERFGQLMDMLAGVIIAEDYDVFLRRTKRGTPEAPNPNPIGMRVMRDLLPWIMEVYGLRPTQESSGSADGSDDESTSSTEPASDAESTS